MAWTPKQSLFLECLGLGMLRHKSPSCQNFQEALLHFPTPQKLERLFEVDSQNLTTVSVMGTNYRNQMFAPGNVCWCNGASFPDKRLGQKQHKQLHSQSPPTCLRLVASVPPIRGTRCRKRSPAASFKRSEISEDLQKSAENCQQFLVCAIEHVPLRPARLRAVNSLMHIYIYILIIRRGSSGGMERLGVWNCDFSGSEISNFGAWNLAKITLSAEFQGFSWEIRPLKNIFRTLENGHSIRHQSIPPLSAGRIIHITKFKKGLSNKSPRECLGKMQSWVFQAFSRNPKQNWNHWNRFFWDQKPEPGLSASLSKTAI